MDEEAFLGELATKLRAVKTRGLATQIDISDATGIDQATISRALNRRHRRRTTRLNRLDEYVNILLSGGPLPSNVQDAARDFLVRGGTEAELIASIRHSATLVLRSLG